MKRLLLLLFLYIIFISPFLPVIHIVQQENVGLGYGSMYYIIDSCGGNQILNKLGCASSIENIFSIIFFISSILFSFLLIFYTLDLINIIKIKNNKSIKVELLKITLLLLISCSLIISSFNIFGNISIISSIIYFISLIIAVIISYFLLKISLLYIIKKLNKNKI